VVEKVSILVANPSAGSGVAAFGPGGHLSVGQYSWQVTFVVPGGEETEPSLLASGTASADEVATLTLPIGP
jgi:hypothetical protein